MALGAPVSATASSVKFREEVQAAVLTGVTVTGLGESWK